MIVSASRRANMRGTRTRSSASPPRAPLTRHALGSGRRLCATLTLTLALELSACHRGNAVLRRPNQPDAVSVASTDTEMNQAMAQARASLTDFRQAVRNPGSSKSKFSMKVKVADGEAIEYIWVAEPALVGQGFRGRVANEPIEVRTVSVGQSVEFQPEQVSDWMYLEDGVLRGGFTIRVLLDRVSPEERARMLRSFTFRME
jgi:uncharacterized protein YegJ (DUF2314 family)